MRSENQYSKRDGSLIRIMNAAMSPSVKYIAFCEGDDYWIDPYKLQRQVDFLEEHPDYSMCFHDAYRLIDGKVHSSYKQYSHDGDACLCDVVINGGLFCPTASIMLRKSLYNDYPEFAKKCHVGDFPMQIYMALKGRVHFMRDVMSVYRIGAIGSWTDMMKCLDADKVKEKMNNEISMLNAFNEYSNYKFNDIFSKRISSYRVRTLVRIACKKSLKSCIIHRIP